MIVSKLGMAALFSVVLAGCSSTGSDSEPAVESTNALTASPAPVQRQPSAEELREQAMLAITTFYFDFDKSELKPEAREALAYHARKLQQSRGTTVRLEGHADERGTREYNQALGERRAKAVENYLLVQGVAASQLEIVSYGEERPVDRATTEAAYSKNRRVELIYQ